MEVIVSHIVETCYKCDKTWQNWNPEGKGKEEDLDSLGDEDLDKDLKEIGHSLIEVGATTLPRGRWRLF